MVGFSVRVFTISKSPFPKTLTCLSCLLILFVSGSRFVLADEGSYSWQPSGSTPAPTVSAIPPATLSENTTVSVPEAFTSEEEAAVIQTPMPHPFRCTCENCTALTGKQRIPLIPYWENGLRLISPEENFQLHLGGNLQWDSIWMIAPEGVLESGNNSTSTGNSGASLLRRARFKFDGNIYRYFDYSIEFDMANSVNENKGQQNPTQDNVANSPFPCNVWVQMREVPYLGRVRVGNQVKPLGMTNNTYQGFLPFLERADNMDGFYGPFDEGFDPGIAAINWTPSERTAWRYGIYRPLKNASGIGINEYSVIGRLTTLPVFENDGRRLLHVGISASQGTLVQDEFRIRARPLLRNGPGYAVPILADTGTLPATNQYTIGPELATVVGPWTMQAEWTGQFYSDVQSNLVAGQQTAFFHGGYVQLLYFLTGEHQQYEKQEGVFGRVVPLSPLKPGSRTGCGAWQLGVRFSYLDLVNRSVDGGQIQDMTVGLNWFLNPNMKVQSNYIVENRNGQNGIGDGVFSGFGIRAACDF